MPGPIAAAAPALASGGMNLIGQGLNIWQNERQNRLSREFSREMYNRQFRDNISFWNMQNAYNSPEAQVARLKAAGLNPALMYGGKGGGMAGASGNAGPIHTQKAMAARFEPTNFNNLSRLIADMQGSNLLRAQERQIDSKTLLNLRQAALVGTEKDTADFELGKASELRQTSIDMQREILQNLKARTKTELDRNEREKALTANTILQGAEKVLNMQEDRIRSQAEREKIKATIAVLKQDERIKKAEAELRQVLMSFNDDAKSRIIGTIIKKIIEQQGGVDKTAEEIVKFMKGLVEIIKMNINKTITTKP